MGKGLLLLLVGSSGSGKNTIINTLTKEKNNVKFLVSHTTREKREGEKNGVTYNFVTTQEFEEAIKSNEMLEYDITHKGYYGISKKTISDALSLGGVVVKDISILGVVNCREQLSKKTNIVSVFLTESKHVLKKRLIARGEKNYKLRLKIYNKEQSQMYLNDYIIKNSELSGSVEIVKAIMKHHTNNITLLPVNSVVAINEKKVNKYVKLVFKGKKLAPIKVALVNDKIYIVDGLEKYLASLKSGKIWAKRFVSVKPKTLEKLEEQNTKKWLELISKIKK